MIAGLSLSSCWGVTPFSVSTPTSNPALENARKKNTTAYTRNIRAPSTIRAAPLRNDCSLDIVSSLVSTTLRWMTTDETKVSISPGWSEAKTHREASPAHNFGFVSDRKPCGAKGRRRETRIWEPWHRSQVEG